MWVRANPNPEDKIVPDCVIRAISIALGKSWLEVYDSLCLIGRNEYNLPNANTVWGKYLWWMGFEPFMLPESCPGCNTIRNFCKKFYKGTYIIGTGNHAVAVIDGNYYDTWDSGDLVPAYFWRIAY